MHVVIGKRHVKQCFGFVSACCKICNNCIVRINGLLQIVFGHPCFAQFEPGIVGIARVGELGDKFAQLAYFQVVCFVEPMAKCLFKERVVGTGTACPQSVAVERYGRSKIAFQVVTVANAVVGIGRQVLVDRFI